MKNGKRQQHLYNLKHLSYDSVVGYIEQSVKMQVYEIVQDLYKADRITEFPLELIQLDFFEMLAPVFKTFKGMTPPNNRFAGDSQTRA